jgi:hypothetical protein
MEHLRHVEAIALVSEVPKFLPVQWQRLFWDTGLSRATVHLFIRDAHPHSPWTMVVDTQKGVIDLEAFTLPLPPEMLGEVTVRGADEGELLQHVRGHGARIEVFATSGRCEPQVAHDLVARVASGLLRTTYGIAWLHPASGILTPAAACAERMRDVPKGQVPMDFYSTVRETEHSPTVVVDTLGLANFDHPDLEIEVDRDDAVDTREFVTGLARSIAGRSYFLVEGDTLAGPLGLRWSATIAKSRVPPVRRVLRLRLSG